MLAGRPSENNHACYVLLSGFPVDVKECAQNDENGERFANNTQTDCVYPNFCEITVFWLICVYCFFM